MELDLKKILSLLLSKIWIIISVTMLSGVLFLVYTFFFVTPLYTSQALLYISNMSERKSSIMTTGDVNVSRELVDTFVVILNSRTVLDKVAEESGLDYSSTQIKKMISTEAVSATEVFRISVTNASPEDAQTIADAILKVAPSEIKRVINAGAVSVIDYATLPLSPPSPNIPRNTVLGAFLGAVATIFLILLIEGLDTRVKNEFVLAENFELPIIGVVPSFKLVDKHARKRKRRA